MQGCRSEATSNKDWAEIENLKSEGLLFIIHGGTKEGKDREINVLGWNEEKTKRQKRREACDIIIRTNLRGRATKQKGIETHITSNFFFFFPRKSAFDGKVGG